jgi:hypothetical protein
MPPSKIEDFFLIIYFYFYGFRDGTTSVLHMSYYSTLRTYLELNLPYTDYTQQDMDFLVYEVCMYI